MRIYSRVLTQTEIQTDMNTAVVNPDSGPPTQPTNLAAIGSLSSVALAWSGSSDDVGVVRYNVHRSTTQGFTPSAANRVGQPTATSFGDSPLGAGTYYYRVTAEDAAGNISVASAEASAIVTGDTTAPTPPSSLVAAGSISSVALTWGASSDNVAVVRYNVHRSTTNGFTPSAANRIAQPATASYNDTGLAAGTYYYRVTAEDAAGNLSTASDQATATVTGDTTAPTAPANLTATPGSGTATLGWSASTDNVGVARYNVHRSTTNGFTPSVANRIAQPTGTSYADSGLASGTYYYRVTAEDAAGNVSAASAQATAVVSAQPAGLVAAYGFDAGSGTAVADASGNNNNGTLANGTWSAAGRYGGAIQFNGTNTWVSVPNATSLNPTAGVTMEAWVNPVAVNNWRTVMFKEQTGNLTYGIYSNTSSNRPNAQVFVAGSDRNVNGTAAGRGEHVDASRGHLRRRERPALRERDAGCDHRPDRGARDLDRRAAHRRQRRVGRVVPGADRRGSGLQPGAERDRDPGRHGDEHRKRGHEPADGAFRAHADGRAELGRAFVDGLDGQRGRRPLQRPPLDHAGLHTERGQPHRAADRCVLLGQPALARDLLLPRDRRGRRRQHQRGIGRVDRCRDRATSQRRPSRRTSWRTAR